MTTETLTLLLPAFLTGMLVFLVHVPLGQEVLRRGIIFIDLAIAQIAALGVVAAGALHLTAPFAVQAVAFSAALAAALFFRFTERRLPQQQEAIIGAGFVAASSLSLLLMAKGPQGGEALEGMLAGQILWASMAPLPWVTAAYVAVLAAWFLLPGRVRWFYPLFAVTVTIAVQLVGVYLVFASLILPALATASLSGRTQLLAGYTVSLAALVSGLALSYLGDFPAGPLLVCVLAVLCAGLRLGLAVAQERGGRRP